MKWGLGRKAQWLVEELNAEHLLGERGSPIGVAAGRRKRFEFSRAGLPISAEEARVRRADVSTADLANWWAG